MEEEYTEDELDMVEEFMQTSHLSKLTVRVPSQSYHTHGVEPPRNDGRGGANGRSVRPPRQLPAAP